MLGNEKYCVVLPAATPLFLHVFYGLDQFIPKEFKSKIRIYINPASVSDSAVAQIIFENQRKDGSIPLAGICDPRQAADNNLEIHGAVVKRLGFFLVSHKNNSGSALANILETKNIFAHGPENTNGAEVSNTALALAGNLKAYFKLDDCEIKPSKYEEILVDKNSLAITSNLPLALFLGQSGAVQATRISDAFPEWSRLFLSAIVSRPDLDGKERAILRCILIAIQDACRHLRFVSTPETVVKLLRKYFPSSLSPDTLKTHLEYYDRDDQGLNPWELVANELIENRIIPSNIEVSRFGAQLTDALWCRMRLSNNTIYARGERMLLVPVEQQDIQLKVILKKTPITKSLRRELGNGARTDPARSAFSKYFEDNSPLNQTLKNIDVLIVTALEEELEPFTKHLFKRPKRISSSLTGAKHSYITQIEVSPSMVAAQEPRRVALVSIDESGRLPMAMFAASFLERWQPKIIILAGIAGGFKMQADFPTKLKLGDILIPRIVVDYEGQKIIQEEEVKRKETKARLGRRFRDIQYQLSTHLYDLSVDIANERKWIEEIPKILLTTEGRVLKRLQSISPKAQIIGGKATPCLFCGDKVVAAEGYLDDLLEKYTSAMGVEMESSAIAAAIQMRRINNCNFIVLKAVSDFADFRKSGTKAWRHYAIASSAAFVNKLIRHPNLLKG